MAKELRLNLPKGWHELSNRQFVEICRLKLLGFEEIHYLTLVFLYLSGLKVVKTGKYFAYEESLAHYYRHKWIKKPFLIESLVFQEMIQKVNWIFESGECRLLRRIKWAKPCDNRMYNATFEQYLMMENYFQAFEKTQKEEHLNNLVATIYRLPFQKFDSGKIQARAKRFAKVPMPVKFTIYQWATGFRRYVMNECPTLFRPTSEGKKVKIKEQINSMMRMLNKGYITDNPGILKALTWDALNEMEAMAKEYEKMMEHAKH